LGNLFEVLKGIRIPGHSVLVVRSCSYAPGVGGSTMGYLREKLAEVKAGTQAYLIATQLRCHGVVDGLDWEPS